MTHEQFLEEVVRKLAIDAFEATVEYPGYIALGTLSFGTANGFWGWEGSTDETENDFGTSHISVETRDANEVAGYIRAIEYQIRKGLL